MINASVFIAWYSHWYRRCCWGAAQNPLILISMHQRILIATPVPLNAGFVLAVKAHVASKQDSPEVPESPCPWKEPRAVMDGTWQTSVPASSPSTGICEGCSQQSSSAPPEHDLQLPITGTCLACWLSKYSLNE